MGMKLFVTNQTREEYVATQVARSEAKFACDARTPSRAEPAAATQ